VGGLTGGGVVESGGVESETPRDLDTGSESLGVTEAEDTSVVDLGLDESSVVKVGLGSDLERDTAGGGLGVVDSLGTSLDVLADSVVVRSSEGGEVSETVEGDGVVRGGVTESTGVSGDGTGGDIVRSLGTNKETVSANNSVGGEGGALEEVDGSPGVEGRLLVDGSKDGRLLGLGGVKGGSEVQLQSLGDLVLQLDLGSEEVGGGPSLGEGQAVLEVDVLSLNVTSNGGRVGITDTSDLEDNIGRGGSLDLEGDTVGRVVLDEEVRGGLAEVFPRWGNGLRHCYVLSIE